MKTFVIAFAFLLNFDLALANYTNVSGAESDCYFLRINSGSIDQAIVDFSNYASTGVLTPTADARSLALAGRIHRQFARTLGEDQVDGPTLANATRIQSLFTSISKRNLANRRVDSRAIISHLTYFKNLKVNACQIANLSQGAFGNPRPLLNENDPVSGAVVNVFRNSKESFECESPSHPFEVMKFANEHGEVSIRIYYAENSLRIQRLRVSTKIDGNQIHQDVLNLAGHQQSFRNPIVQNSIRSIYGFNMATPNDPGDFLYDVYNVSKKRCGSTR